MPFTIHDPNPEWMPEWLKNLSNELATSPAAGLDLPEEAIQATLPSAKHALSAGSGMVSQALQNVLHGVRGAAHDIKDVFKEPFTDIPGDGVHVYGVAQDAYDGLQKAPSMQDAIRRALSAPPKDIELKK